MEQKLIFLDIDGTLTAPASVIPPDSALEAIRRAQSKGHKVMLCTGRSRKMLSPLLQYGFDGFIGSAGGYVQCGDQLVYDCPLTQEQQDRILPLLAQSQIGYALETAERNFTHPSFREFIYARARSTKSNSEYERWEKVLKENGFFHDLSEYQGQPIYKIVFVTPSPEALQPLRDALESEFQFCLFTGGNLAANGEMINRKFNKGTAILKMCEHLGIPQENTIAFGDSMNDYEMIQTAALGICMENGTEELKAVADEICPAVNEDGLYKAFEKHGLI